MCLYVTCSRAVNRQLEWGVGGRYLSKHGLACGYSQALLYLGCFGSKYNLTIYLGVNLFL